MAEALSQQDRICRPAETEDTELSHAGNQCPAGDDCAYYQEVISLRTAVITDPLTGLYNVRHFREVLEQELERTQRTLISTALLMIDLDHFKQINDRYGHEAGNQVLKQTARLIREGTRRLDVQCRYGGEEFVVILPTTELMLAVHVAERIRESIACTPVYIDDQQQIRVTASVGLALHSAERPMTAITLVEAADEQLYRAKDEGRDRVCYPLFDVPETQVSGDEKQALGSMFGGEPSSAGQADNEDAPDFEFDPDIDDADDFIDDDDGQQWIV